MPNTPIANLRYPDLTSAPNVPLDIGNLAADLDAKITVTAATPSARIALTNKYDGMRVYEASTKRYFRWDATATAWVYAGGAPPPITAATLSGGGTGWTAGTGFAPGCYKDGNGLITVVGGFTNNNAYTPSGNVSIILPTGFRPSVDTACQVMVPAGPGFILGGVYAADGAIRLNYYTGSTIGVGTLHTVNFSFHPGFAGGALV